MSITDIVKFLPYSGIYYTISTNLQKINLHNSEVPSKSNQPEIGRGLPTK